MMYTSIDVKFRLLTFPAAHLQVIRTCILGCCNVVPFLYSTKFLCRQRYRNRIQIYITFAPLEDY